MATLHAQHIFRHDRKQTRESKRPKRRRANKNAATDTADIRARKIEPLAKKDPPQHQLGNNRDENRDPGLLITFQNAVAKMPDEQNESDEERRDIAVVETKSSPSCALKDRSVNWC